MSTRWRRFGPSSSMNRMAQGRANNEAQTRSSDKLLFAIDRPYHSATAFVACLPLRSDSRQLFPLPGIRLRIHLRKAANRVGEEWTVSRSEQSQKQKTSAMPTSGYRFSVKECHGGFALTRLTARQTSRSVTTQGSTAHRRCVAIALVEYQKLRSLRAFETILSNLLKKPSVFAPYIQADSSRAFL
jgi:hypothetical protein